MDPSRSSLHLLSVNAVYGELVYRLGLGGILPGLWQHAVVEEGSTVRVVPERAC